MTPAPCAWCPWAAAGRAAPCPGLDNPAACADARSRREPPPPMPAPRPLAATLAVLDLVRGCDHRWPDPSACSCTSAAYCSLRSATVWPPDCDACRSR